MTTTQTDTHTDVHDESNTRENEQSDNNAVELPHGFDVISDGSLAPDHDFKTHEICVGTLVTKKTVQVRRGARLEDNNLMIVKTTAGNEVVWESAALRDLFDAADPGDIVYVRYLGLRVMGDGRQDMKRFATAIQKSEGRRG